MNEASSVDSVPTKHRQDQTRPMERVSRDVKGKPKRSGICIEVEDDRYTMLTRNNSE